MCFEVYPASLKNFRKKHHEHYVQVHRGKKLKRCVESEICHDRRIFKVMHFHNMNDLKWNEIAYGNWMDGTDVRISQYPLIVEFIGD